ncbi:MAG: glutamate synthase large subunit, partial [Ilyomonas sp.]
MPEEYRQEGLYNPSFEHDACGIGFVASIKGTKSHQNVSDALTVLERMAHRGACGCENNTGDGAGIMIQTPHEFFFDECIKLGVHLPAFGKYGVGVIFFPKEIRLREECREIFNRSAENLGLEILAYRKVPVNPNDIGGTALSVEPEMEQVFIACPDHVNDREAFERKLFVLRNYASHTINNTVRKDAIGFYIASLSYKTVVYKGQLTSEQVRTYFPDLSNKRVVSAFGLVHSRFATNTFPSWKLAQPFRFIAHNGEINTLQGNLNWLKTSEKGFISPYFTQEEMDMLLPIVTEGQSDSACLDNMIELLALTGRSLPHVMMMLIPEAWDGNEHMDPVKKAFYEYHASLMEPWDGPASISFTDGKIIGATLDRNGLRPSRYCVTTDDRVIMASEAGVLPVDPSMVKEKGRLQPGKMFVVDMEQGRIISDDELKQTICSQKPYGEWLNKYKIRLEELPEPRVMFTHLEPEQIFKYQKAFGYSNEDLENIIAPMALDGKEPIGSMGTDVPLAVLSDQPQHLSSYFKQLFAQVTNPPIDPIRERMVMSLASFVGNNGNLLIEDPLSCHCVALKHPVLNNHELEKIRSIDTGIFQAKTLQTYFRADGKPGSLQAGLDRLCRYALDAVKDGFEVIVLTDRAIDSEHAPIPSLLAVSAVHHHLIRKGLRGEVGIVVEAGDVWEVHHFACLLAFGVTAINPYLALSSIRDMKLSGKLQTDLDVEALKKNYIKSVCDGLLKVFSKMGISTLQSYQGAQIFEIIGLNKSVVDKYFTGATSRIEGMGLDEIAKETLAKHFFAFSRKDIPVDRLPEGGLYQWKRKGEFHLFNPQTIHLLQYATRMNDYNTFKKYSKLVNDQSEKAVTLRSLFRFKRNRPSISIDEVEPAENIYKRFATGAMSFGSISWEAHTTLAIAMNRLGGKSNTGEGGEDERRYELLPNGDSMRSAIKQVASARFGVTSQYLTEADELQIKMAQGAKPGEGGQLPGHKVDEWIGKTRHSTPGVGLISPPPHHDIYSIEDLAQLIFDLKNSNRKARINVKLVSKAGVGTIAAGVAKAKADVVLISGHDGGTGASPVSSIKHAGLPWELGLAETHQTLVKNKLRSRVVVQADGQMKTGRDIAIAALLGAEEWGVATAALIVEGCIMMRKCHMNTCPVGVATQNPELRKRFTGD